MKLNRSITPQISLPTSVELPPITTSRSENGITLYSMSPSVVDVVRLSLVFNAGSRHQVHPFTASTTLNLLSEGSENFSSSEIAEKLDFYGIYYDASCDRDSAMVTITCLEKFLPETLELLQECVVRPTFCDHEIGIYKAKRKQQLSIEREKSAYIAREKFAQVLFGKDHPYGTCSAAVEYDTLTRDHLVDFHTKFINANNCFAVASGNISEQTRAMLISFLETLPVGENRSVEDTCPEPHSSEPMSVKRDGAVQTSLRMGKLLFTKSHPDFVEMKVVAMILGGYFGSRLMQNIREERGYTYGIYSAIVSLEHTGYFAIASDVSSESLDDTLVQIRYELSRMTSEKIDEEELNEVKNMILGELMRILDGPFGVADVVIENIQSGMPAEYLNEFLEGVQSVTPERVSELVGQYLDPDSFTYVTVG